MTGIDIFPLAMRRRNAFSLMGYLSTPDEAIHNILLIEGRHEMTERKEGEAYA